MPCGVFAAEEEVDYTTTPIPFNQKIDYVRDHLMTLTPGTTYKITGMIKITSLSGVTLTSTGNATIQWYHGSNAGVGIGTKDYKTTVPAVVGEWQFFEIECKPTADKVPSEGTAKAWIQLYNAKFSFEIEDYSISVLSSGSAAAAASSENEKNMRLVKNGNFEDAYESTDWTMSDTEAAPTYFGADGTMTALKLDMEANGTFGQSVATVNGTEYAATLYTKGDTAGVSILANETPVVATTEAVADGWIKHTFDYAATGATVFSVTSSADSVFSIDEFSVEPKATPAALYAENIKLSGKLLAGEEISFNWDYSKAYSGKSMVKVYEYVGSAWTVKEYNITASGATSYTLPVLTEADEGKKFKIEILPMEAPQGTTVKSTYYETAAVKKTFDVNTDDNFVNGSTTVSTTVEVTNFTEGKDILITICLYDAKNALIDFDYAYVPSTVNSVISKAVSCAKTGDSAYARVFVWGGTGINSSDMTSIKAVSEFGLN